MAAFTNGKVRITQTRVAALSPRRPERLVKLACSSQVQAPVTTQNGSIPHDACKTFKVAAYSAKRYVKDFMEQPLKQAFPQTNFIEAALDVNTAELAKGYDAVVLFVNDTCTAEVIEKLQEGGVKVIAMRCAGFDRVDVAAAIAAGIKVVRVPTYSPGSVAEHAVAIMFALNRKLHQAHVRVSQGNYTLSGLVGMEISGKTVGVIGTGAIGVEACRIFKGIGMRVLAYDVRPNPRCLDMGVEYMEVDEVIAQSNVVSLHCPLLPSTRHIINLERIKLMQPGTMVINVSRGGLIDSDALFDGLESGRIGALGLDVYENEGSLFFEDFTMFDVNERMKHWDRRFRLLLSYPQVLVTPHSAFLTHEALSNIAGTTIQNLQDFVMGRPLVNEVQTPPPSPTASPRTAA